MAIESEKALERLIAAFEEDRLGHAYLLTGGNDAERMRVATGLMGHLNQTPALEALEHVDAHVIEPQSRSRRITIDQMRQLEGDLALKKGSGRRKIGLIIDAERMTTQAANAFLKTLEEPPDTSLLLMLTGAPDALLQTILSRCIPVNLREPKKVEWSEQEMALLQMLEQRMGQGRFDPIGALRLARDFQALLAHAKEMVEERHQSELKAEQSHYKETTDGGWLGARETYHQAAGQAEYLQERSRLVEVLGLWWAAVLRMKYERPPGLPDSLEPTLGKLASRMETPELLKRIEAIEQMRGHLERNIQEPLALDVGFMEAFG